METHVIDEDPEFEELDKRQKEMKLKEIDAGEFDFSDPKNVEDLTLHDLAELKKEKEKKEQREITKKQNEDLLGDDIEIEWEK